MEQRVFDVPRGLSGNVVGYARVSTRGQSLDLQVDALVAAGAVRVFQEYASGATQARTRWRECLEYLQPGNILVVNDLTRLGRSTADLSDIVTVLGQRGIGFRSLAEPSLDTTSAHGKLIFDMFASLAEYERSRLSERTRAGLRVRRVPAPSVPAAGGSTLNPIRLASGSASGRLGSGQRRIPSGSKWGATQRPMKRHSCGLEARVKSHQGVPVPSGLGHCRAEKCENTNITS